MWADLINKLISNICVEVKQVKQKHPLKFLWDHTAASDLDGKIVLWNFGMPIPGIWDSTGEGRRKRDDTAVT